MLCFLAPAHQCRSGCRSKVHAGHECGLLCVIGKFINFLRGRSDGEVKCAFEHNCKTCLNNCIVDPKCSRLGHRRMTEKSAASRIGCKPRCIGHSCTLMKESVKSREIVADRFPNNYSKRRVGCDSKNRCCCIASRCTMFKEQKQMNTNCCCCCDQCDDVHHDSICEPCCGLSPEVTYSDTVKTVKDVKRFSKHYSRPIRLALGSVTKTISEYKW